jgi:iron(II)-dependent oxidoreductase
MGATSERYSAATRLRQGTTADVRAALVVQRERTLEIADAYIQALGPQLAVPRDTGLNPPRWELGHVAWFQEWWVARNGQRHLGVRADPDCARLPSAWRDADQWFDSSRVAHATRWDLPLPVLGDIREWLAATLETTLRLLDGLPADAGDDALYFFRLVCLHEAMHAEAACYMARTLGFAIPEQAGALPANSDIHVPAQLWRLGHAGPGFAFDNEVPAQDVELEPFSIDAVPVSWDRFHTFTDAGGYADARWWSDEGWQWSRRERKDASSLLRGAGAAIHLSAFEAQAWCRWAGRRLPTEAEWECAAMTQPGLAWGFAWEWTASPFAPYPGFQPHPYRDYSQPWFGSRRVLRGACPATSPLLAHPRYRNFFEPHRHDVFAGFRSCAITQG